MYFTRTSPIIRDRNVDAISRMVAVKAVCVCEGRSIPRPRAHRERAGGRD
jgi:hypothetical protein